VAVDFIDNNIFVQSIIDKGIADRAKRNTGDLGKDEFLNLMILQLRYQDPLNPVDDKQFLAQMAQFTALEQMQNLNSSFSSVKAFSMIGKYVYGTIKDEATGINKSVEGHVESVLMSGSRTYVVVAGMDVPVENIYNVADGFNPLASSLAAYTNLLGYNVFGAVYDITTGEVVGVEGDVVSLAKGLYEDYALLNNVSVSVSGRNINGVNDIDRSKLVAYLEEKAAETDPDKRNVELFITDANGKKVPVAAILKSYKVEPDGSVSVVLDSLAIPVTSVSKIKPSGQASTTSGGTAGTGNEGSAGGTGGTGETGETGGADETGGDGPEGSQELSGTPDSGNDAGDGEELP